MLSFFIITSVWWWIVTVAFLIFIVWGTAREDWIMSFSSILIYLLLAQVLFDSPVIQSIVDNPLIILMFVFGYFPVGAMWSFYKWYLRVKDYVEKHNETKKDYFIKLKDNENLDEVSIAKRWEENYSFNMDKRPKASKSKGDISYWITYWPLSMINFFFEDFLRRIVDSIMARFQGVYSKIENKAYSKLK